MDLCPTCASDDAPRPTGTQTFTYNGVTHKARECAAFSSLGQTVIRTDTGYAAESGLLVCMACFPHGRQHLYSPGQEPHGDS